MSTSKFWRETVFRIVVVGCLLFLVLTIIAMLIYPGGTLEDKTTTGYQFLYNFFSDLGRTIAYSTKVNPAALLFNFALACAGIALGLFFVSYTQFFTARAARLLSFLGSIAGVLSAFGFIGIALTPANLNRPLHLQFVFWAFRFFLLAMLVYLPASLLQPGFPRKFSLVLIIFTILLAMYTALITFGPDPEIGQGLIIQVTGQKIIAYASVICILLLANGARENKVN